MQVPGSLRKDIVKLRWFHPEGQPPRGVSACVVCEQDGKRRGPCPVSTHGPCRVPRKHTGDARHRDSPACPSTPPDSAAPRIRQMTPIHETVSVPSIHWETRSWDGHSTAVDTSQLTQIFVLWAQRNLESGAGVVCRNGFDSRQKDTQPPLREDIHECVGRYVSPRTSPFFACHL